MERSRIYKQIVWAKEQIERLDFVPSADEPGETFSWLHLVASGERLPRQIMILWPQCTWGQKMALLTVLCTGHFIEDEFFMMPSTKDCMENYKKIVHAYKHGRRLTVYVKGDTDTWPDGHAWHHPDYRIDVRTDRVEILYNTECEYDEEEW